MERDNLLSLERYKRMKSRRKVLNAMERFYSEVFTELKTDGGEIDPAEMQEFFVAVIADHLMGHFSSAEDLEEVSGRYRHFDNRLRSCLSHRMHSFRQFLAAEARGNGC